MSMSRQSGGRAEHPSASAWRRALVEARQLTDGLGYPVDSGILDLVAVLRMLGFETTGSCEGHLNWGHAAPWVDIGEQPPRELLKRIDFSDPDAIDKHPVLRRWRARNLRAQRRLLTLLDQCYDRHNPPETHRFILESMGVYGAVRLVNQGYAIQLITPKPEQRKRLAEYQREARRLVSFLRRRAGRGGDTTSKRSRASPTSL